MSISFSNYWGGLAFVLKPDYYFIFHI